VTGSEVTWPQVTKSDPEVTSYDRMSPGSGWRRPKACVCCTFHFIQGCSSQAKAVTWRHSTSHDLRWLEVTQKWRLTVSLLEVPVEGRKHSYSVHFTSYKAAARRGGSHVAGNDITWSQVTGSDPEVTSFDRKSPASGWRRPKTHVYCTFHSLQGCSSQEKAVTWRELTSRDLRWL